MTRLVSKPDRKLKATDSAYIAGLFDGEGCINAAIGTRRYTPKKQQKFCFHAWGRLNFSISNTDRNLLEKVQKIAYGFGGIYPKRPVHGAVNSWRVTEPIELHLICDSIIPYVKLKKKPLQLATKAAEYFLSRENLQHWTKADLIFFNEKFVLPLQKPIPSGKRGRPPEHTFKEIISNLC